MGRYRNFFPYPHIFAALSNPGTQPEREPVISSVTRLSTRLRAFLSTLTLLFLLLASVLLTEGNPGTIRPLLRRGGATLHSTRWRGRCRRHREDQNKEETDGNVERSDEEENTYSMMKAASQHLSKEEM